MVEPIDESPPGIGHEKSIEEDSARVVVDWYTCRYRPSPDEDGTPDFSQEKLEASCRLMEHFGLSLRARFRVSVILFGAVYGFSHLCILVLEWLLKLTPNRAGLDFYALVVRISVVILCCAVVISPQFRFWDELNPCCWQYFRFLVLLKSLALCAVQLMQKEPSYGYIVFNQAFIYTFLPMHPLPTAVIAFATLALYCFVGMYFLNLGQKQPMIAVGLGFLQALAHARRYNWMLQGHLQVCNMKHQKQLLAKEEQDCDHLLRSMLPATILHNLQRGLDMTPEHFDNVTVLFAEICDFSSITQHSSASDVVVILNMVFSALDSITDKWGVHKVETVCQVYMAVAGCPERNHQHAAMAANTALDILDSIRNRTCSASDDDPEQCKRREQVKKILGHRELQIRVGLNSGAIRAGVIGIRNTRFKLFGDTVNTASRMESTCERQHVQVSATTAGLLQKKEATGGWHFDLRARGEIDIKGKGKMHTHYLLSSRKATAEKADAPHTANAEMEDRQSPVLGGEASRSLALGKQSSIRAEEVMFGLNKLREDMKLDRATSSMAVAVMAVQEERPKRSFQNLSLCWLSLRRFTLLATTDNMVDRETLEALDEDNVAYSRGCYQKWLKALQGKGVLIILLLSFLEWMDYWTYLAHGGWGHAMHLSVTLRNGVIVPLIVGLMCISNMSDYFRAYLNYIIILATSAIAMLVVHSAYTVYVGDSGYFLSFLLLFLDVAVIPLRWRIVSSIIMIIWFAVLQLVDPAASDSHSTVSFLVCIYTCFCLAVHGQEHFTHLSDYKLRKLQTQNTRLEQVQKMKWQLLADFLPLGIASRILEDRGADIIAENYEDVTILFTDMKGFTAFSSKLDPAELACFLNSMYSSFDEILERFGLHKVEVIGDAYFVVSGAPETDRNRTITPAEHAAFAAEAALAMVNVLPNICEDASVCIRVGLHSGSVVGGVVGRKDPRFHLFGHTVELANRMEEYSMPNRVHISSDTHAHLTALANRWNSHGDDIFSFEDRGLIDIPSAPEPLHTYFLLRSTFNQHYRMQQRREQRQRATMTSTPSVVEADIDDVGSSLAHIQESMRLSSMHRQADRDPSPAGKSLLIGKPVRFDDI
eukprot:TRINITY_DN6070_c0_g3_i1.p1 TRINITY_DN6070_c0_g3~~TRINITY_DN6070_c0_g3_i1.p1  ORF type:complete len:1104 (+),score=176.92 TRINITY_DN6070_c0_g3_i1:76-3387(+)